MRFVPAIGIVAALLAPAGAGAQAKDPAMDAVQTLDDGLIGIMKSGSAAGAKGRGAAIAPVLDRVYDLPQMTRIAIGPAWTTITPVDQAALTAAFRRMTIAQYASNFDGFSGQSFTIDPAVQARGADRVVRTTLKSPKAEPVTIAYRLRQSGGSWKIIDVFYRNSISQLATRRADFAPVLQSGGAKALIGHMNALSAKSGG